MLIEMCHTRTDRSLSVHRKNIMLPSKAFFDGARAEHMAQGAKDRTGIDKAGQMKDVVSFTKRVQSSKVRIPPSLITYR